MIKSVELENFQSHKHVFLEMGNLTTLTGPSNSGKSSVLRAIAALLKNDSVPRYIRHGEKQLKVKLVLDSGYSVEWIKGSGENTYIIYDINGNKSIFQKVGSDVPEEVAKVLKLTPIKMEDGTKLPVNIHSQLEAPFMVKDTPGQIAKIFGELTSASKLYAAVSEGNKRTFRNRALKKTRKEDLDHVDTQLSTDFKHLNEYRECLNETIALSISLKELQKKESDVYDINASIEKSLTDSNSLHRSLQTLKNISIVSLKELEETSITLSIVEELSSELQKVERLKLQIIQALSVIENVNSVTYLDDLLESSLKMQAISHIQSQIISHQDRISKYKSNESKLLLGIRKLDKQIDILYSKLEDCPSCGQVLKGNAKEHLLGEALV